MTKKTVYLDTPFYGADDEEALLHNEIGDIEWVYHRDRADYAIYVITPGVGDDMAVHIAHLVDDSHKRPEDIILCIIGKTADGRSKFTGGQRIALREVEKIVKAQGVTVVGYDWKALYKVADWVKSKAANN